MAAAGLVADLQQDTFPDLMAVGILEVDLDLVTSPLPAMGGPVHSGLFSSRWSVQPGQVLPHAVL